MQTFLPYPDFAASAAVLDRLRLGKQRVETLQVLRGLTVPTYGWRHHPAVKMWAGYEEALVRYGLEMCREWTAAGRGDTVAESLLVDFERHSGHRTVRTQEELARVVGLPPWLGREDFHLAHRSSLVRKNPDFYRPVFGDVPDVPYVWPR
ncbi:MSMEG_6728 family protein [Micromonospora sp. NPDC049679]|uniref:MSMEG_6728 family protein n=1 Tax=Micromonospora sp. NPDC049679 TaxID=3155920 RepID=UPI0033F34168